MTLVLHLTLLLIVIKPLFKSEVTPKVKQYFKKNLFKQPKGLAVCELQAAGPLTLP